ncbi:MAG TPA: PAS domain S-box protein [Kofleriaceae bacterium]|jgi:two-component system sensor kinase FixL|nr:PAS domain S-box protein [Kofleriaceae bacterium]
MVSAELRALLDAAVDAIVMVDEQERITTFNPAAERLFGYSAESAIGRDVAMLMPEPYRSEHHGYVSRYMQTGEPHIIGIGRETLALRADGQTFPIALSVGEARGPNGRRFVAIIRDLTALRAAEQSAHAVELRLSQVGRFNLMGEMAAGIAHEINQPLGAIATYAQAAKRILEREHPEMQTLIDVCKKIDEQALRAGRVLENLRKFIRKQEIRTEPIDLNKVIVDVLNLIEADAHAEGIRVVLRLGSELSAVRANAVQLQQVVLNLTRNAVDAMRDSSGKERDIEVATERTAMGGVRISVADHGPGVLRQLGDNIFHPFVTTKREGLGVGLAISRTIVQSYGGSLAYQDNPGGGAIFVVELPPPEESSQ